MVTFVSLLVTTLLIVVDQLTKCWAITALHIPNRVVSVIHDVFEFRYTENPGVAFSMLEGKSWFFIPVTLLVSGMLLVVLLRSPLRRYSLFNVVCVLILSGAIGNLIDRIVYGYVVDFLYFKLIDFPIFNVADCYVVIGAVLLLFFVLFVMKEDDDTPIRTLLFGIRKDEKEQNDG